MVEKSQEEQGKALLAQIQKAVESGDSRRAANLYGDLITLAERTGQIDQTTSRRLRMDLVTEMIKVIQNEPIREKVTLSLPQDVLKALRIAAAETSKEMSEIVADALHNELKKYVHASDALRKKK